MVLESLYPILRFYAVFVPYLPQLEICFLIRQKGVCNLIDLDTERMQLYEAIYTYHSTVAVTCHHTLCYSFKTF